MSAAALLMLVCVPCAKVYELQVQLQPEVQHGAALPRAPLRSHLPPRWASPLESCRQACLLIGLGSCAQVHALRAAKRVGSAADAKGGRRFSSMPMPHLFADDQSGVRPFVPARPTSSYAKVPDEGVPSRSSHCRVDCASLSERCLKTLDCGRHKCQTVCANGEASLVLPLTGSRECRSATRVLASRARSTGLAPALAANKVSRRTPACLLPSLILRCYAHQRWTFHATSPLCLAAAPATRFVRCSLGMLRWLIQAVPSCGSPWHAVSIGVSVAATKGPVASVERWW